MGKLFNRKRKTNYNHIEVLERPNSFVSESIQKTIVNLEYINIDKKYKVIQVTSTLSGEGKTTLIANMGILLGQRNNKVVIVDLDLRRPKVHKVFQFSNNVGISNVLHGSANLKDAINKTPHGVDVLTSGEKTGAVVSLLQSEKMAEVIKELKDEYDYILVDTPPTQVNSDAIMISRLMDGVVYVIGYDQVKKNIIRDSILQLKRREIDILGCVFTQYKVSRKDLLSSINYYEDD